MTIPRTTAKKLCTDVEFTLVNESFPPHVSDLSHKALTQRVKRARTARDKYRALAERQTREARGRTAARSTRPAESNRNTVIKQKIFDETLARFERRAGTNDEEGARRGKAVAAPAKTAKSPAAKKDGSATKIPSLSKVVAKVSKAVTARKASAASPKPEPAKSSKAPASTVGTRAKKGSSSREAIPGPNPKGPEFPRNPHERGRHAAAFKRQQARRDAR